MIAAIEERAGGLGLKANIYLGILLRNNLIRGGALTLREGRAPIGEAKREPFPLSLPHELRNAAARRAKKAGGNFTALLEHVVGEDLKKPRADLCILVD